MGRKTCIIKKNDCPQDRDINLKLPNFPLWIGRMGPERTVGFYLFIYLRCYYYCYYRLLLLLLLFIIWRPRECGLDSRKRFWRSSLFSAGRKTHSLGNWPVKTIKPAKIYCYLIDWCSINCAGP